MTLLFDKFPLIPYDMEGKGRNFQVVTNIFVRYGVTSDAKNNLFMLYDYLISDGDTPDNLAHKIYGDSEFHWILLWLNNITNPLVDWPRNSDAFNKFIISKYNSLELAQTTTHHYTKTINRKALLTGITNIVILEIDQTAYNSLPASSFEIETLRTGTDIEVTTTKEIINCYDYEVDINEKKRNIKILKPNYLGQITSEFNKLMEMYGVKSNLSKRIVR